MIRQNQADTLQRFKPQLVSMGFDANMCDRVFEYFAPDTINDYIRLMSREDGRWQHNFIENTNRKGRCAVCGRKSNHLDRESEENDLDNSEDGIVIDPRHANYDKNRVKDRYNELVHNAQNDYPILHVNSNVNVDLNINSVRTHIQVGKAVEISQPNDNLKQMRCLLCDEEITQKQKKDVDVKCNHLFCQGCWLQYLQEKIKVRYIKKIACMQQGCEELLLPEFIWKIIKQDKEITKLYDKYKLQDKINDNPNLKCCPSPNCEGYARRKKPNMKYVICNKCHRFCFNCLKPWHNRTECKEEINKGIDIFLSRGIIKKCPHCGYGTEKNQGCSHMKCRQCNQNWCWICNQPYEENHYDSGPCKGLRYSDNNNQNVILEPLGEEEKEKEVVYNTCCTTFFPDCASYSFTIFIVILSPIIFLLDFTFIFLCFALFILVAALGFGLLSIIIGMLYTLAFAIIGIIYSISAALIAAITIVFCSLILIDFVLFGIVCIFIGMFSWVIYLCNSCETVENTFKAVWKFVIFICDNLYSFMVYLIKTIWDINSFFTPFICKWLKESFQLCSNIFKKAIKLIALNLNDCYYFCKLCFDKCLEFVVQRYTYCGEFIYDGFTNYCTCCY